MRLGSYGSHVGRLGQASAGLADELSPRSLLTRLWATPVYRLLDDPDGRPLRLRLKRQF